MLVTADPGRAGEEYWEFHTVIPMTLEAWKWAVGGKHGLSPDGMGSVVGQECVAVVLPAFLVEEKHREQQEVQQEPLNIHEAKRRQRSQLSLKDVFSPICFSPEVNEESSPSETGADVCALQREQQARNRSNRHSGAVSIA